VRTSPSRWLPAPHQLEQAPELAILAALDQVLELAACALHVAHPESHADPDCPSWAREADHAIAEGLLARFDDLRLLLGLYRDGALRPADLDDEDADEDVPPCAAPPDDDFPF
jgi:hypothetical protein